MLPWPSARGRASRVSGMSQRSAASMSSTDPKQAARFLEPLATHLNVHGLGSISEIFDGDAPFAPRGCISQAWSVAEVLRAWIATAEAGRTIKPERAKGISA